jgi:hypothetical protein
MLRSTPQTRTLHRAIDVCGGVMKLAQALDVTVGELSFWIQGHVTPPAEVFIQALDLVAGGRDTGR